MTQYSNAQHNVTQRITHAKQCGNKDCLQEVLFLVKIQKRLGYTIIFASVSEKP